VSEAPEQRVPEEKSPAPAAVIVVGSLHYDIMVDAPYRPRKGETIAGRRWSPKFGGKGGNQAVAARRQGVPTVMVGAVGDDSFGTALLAGLDRARVDRTNVAVLSGVGSGMSVAIFDDDGDYGAVIVSGANLAIAPGQASAELLSQGKVLVLQNEIPEIVNEAVARHARDLGVATILNAPRPPALSPRDLLSWSTFWSLMRLKPRCWAADMCPRWKLPAAQRRGLQRDSGVSL
jgi:ribokinase